MGQRPFKDFFVRITALFVKEDWTWDDFVEAQKLRDDIRTARNTNLFTDKPSPINAREYSLLDSMIAYLIVDMRCALNGGETK